MEEEERGEEERRQEMGRRRVEGGEGIGGQWESGNWPGPGYRGRGRWRNDADYEPRRRGGDTRGDSTHRCSRVRADRGGSGGRAVGASLTDGTLGDGAPGG